MQSYKDWALLFLLLFLGTESQAMARSCSLPQNPLCQKQEVSSCSRQFFRVCVFLSKKGASINKRIPFPHLRSATIGSTMQMTNASLMLQDLSSSSLLQCLGVKRISLQML